MWWKIREVLRAVTRRMDYTLARRATVLREHRTTQLTASRLQRIAESALAGLGKVLGVRVR